MSATFWARRAWVQGAWATGVTLRVDANGSWSAVTPDTSCPDGATVIDAPVVPGVINAHSHAFQRAFAGLSERRESTRDDFWSWRDRMYAVALRITPSQLEAVATHLYAELLAGGYTHTCEFHYLHHAEDGRPYSAHGGNDAAMCEALAAAAAATGMGLTILPVLYQRAGFTQPSLRDDQRRFATDVARVLSLRDTVRSWRLPLVDAGVAIHSLRAADAVSMRELVAACAGDPTPIHLHIAEQTGEVEDCVAATGARPIEWLVREFALDSRWQLVHATHATPEEISGVAATGAGVVLCPGTEANLGDGVCDLPRWLQHEVPLALGSDSNVTRSWAEELRILEYGQRLALRQRNVGADPATEPATASRLLTRVLDGGARAAGQETWGFRVGARADLVEVNTSDPALTGLPATHLLDGVVFASPSRPFARAMVAGRWVPTVETSSGFTAAMAQVWASPMPAAHITHAELHFAVISHFVDHGCSPTIAQLAALFGRPASDVSAALAALEEYHGVVRHPVSGEIWAMHPFSSAPTGFYVQSARGGAWWGNCAWCALGIAALVGDDVTITTTLGAESEQRVIRIVSGEVVSEDLVVHFPIPMTRAWDNVTYTCSVMLAFASDAAVDSWCTRHAVPRGDVRSLRTVWEFARVWYGRHLDRQWSKWTTAEARAIFERFGLTGPIWALPGGDDRF